MLTSQFNLRFYDSVTISLIIYFLEIRARIANDWPRYREPGGGGWTNQASLPLFYFLVKLSQNNTKNHIIF